MSNPFDVILEEIKVLNQKIDKLSTKKEPVERPRQYTVGELAKHAFVSELTIRNWIKEGKLKASRIGRRIVINEEQFQDGLKDVKSLKYKR